jgi:hypothetical protein
MPLINRCTSSLRTNPQVFCFLFCLFHPSTTCDEGITHLVQNYAARRGSSKDVKLVCRNLACGKLGPRLPILREQDHGIPRWEDKERVWYMYITRSIVFCIYLCLATRYLKTTVAPEDFKEDIISTALYETRSRRFQWRNGNEVAPRRSKI